MMTRPAAAVLMVAVLVAAVSLSSEAAMTCSDVYRNLMPCLGYLQSGGGNAPPPTTCCNGIGTLMAEANVKADRQTACNCLKMAASSVNGINYDLAGTLPKRCGVAIPYKISPSTDCNKVN